MAGFENFFNHHSFGFWLGFAIALVLVVIWLLVTNARQRRLRQRFESALAEVEGGGVPAMLNEYMATARKMVAQTGQVEERVNHLYGTLPLLVRHVGLVRFSPFHDTGGDQSFSVAILDGRGDGVVLSALHSRQDSKLYAKPIEGRSSEYALTEEEKRAIQETVSQGDLATTP